MTMKSLATVILVVMGVVALIPQRWTLSVTGLKPLYTPTVAALEEPPRDESAAARFLRARDSVVVVVPRDMTAGEFLALYQIQFEHVRQQIARQIGLKTLPVDHVLRKNDRFRIKLTAPDVDEP